MDVPPTESTSGTGLPPGAHGETAGGCLLGLPGRGELGEGEQRGRDAGPEPHLPAQPQRLLQLLTGDVEVALLHRVETQMPHGIGGGQRVARLLRERVRALQRRQRGVAVAPYHLVERPYPEARLGFAAHLAEPLVELDGALEEGELARILFTVREKPGVQDPTARQREVCFDRVQLVFRGGQSLGVPAEDCLLVAFRRAVQPVIPHAGQPTDRFALVVVPGVPSRYGGRWAESARTAAGPLYSGKALDAPHRRRSAVRCHAAAAARRERAVVARPGEAQRARQELPARAGDRG